jgi:hypothetical protein
LAKFHSVKQKPITWCCQKDHFALLGLVFSAAALAASCPRAARRKGSAV